MRDQLALQGMETPGRTPEQLGSFIRDEIARWAKVIKASGIKPE